MSLAPRSLIREAPEGVGSLGGATTRACVRQSNHSLSAKEVDDLTEAEQIVRVGWRPGCSMGHGEIKNLEKPSSFFFFWLAISLNSKNNKEQRNAFCFGSKN